ncbi:MAG: hypothetical protein U1E65_32010 [Myxococcota bacterium]
MQTRGRQSGLPLALLLLLSCSPGAGNNPLGPDDPNAAGPIPPTLDTDHDAVPDAQEDRNQNGTVDPGETDPTKTDSDGDGIPDANEVAFLACNRSHDRKITVFDVPGADAMLMVDAVVSEHSMLKTSDGRAPGLELSDPTTGIAAVLIGKHPSSGVQSPPAQRDAERRSGLAALGDVSAATARTFTTVEGFAAEQATFRITFAQAMDVQSAAHKIGEALAGVPLTGALPPSTAGTNRTVTVRFLTVLRSASRVVEVAAVLLGDTENDPASIRMDEFTDGTNVARHGSFTRHVCDQLAAKAESKADILFVVDDSGSMEDDQQALRNAASAMGDVLANAKIDYRLAVARMWAPDGMSSNRRGSLEGGGFTANLAEFQQEIVVGANGGWEPGLEVGISAIDRALPRTPAGDTANPHRLREGAATVVIVLSDERDQTMECAACGTCEADQLNRQMFCSDPAGQRVVDDFVQKYRARNAVFFAIVGDMPNGCRQTGQRDDFEPGQGYVEVANGTGGQFGSLCGDMAQNLRDVARVTSGVASAYHLSSVPASASLQVAIGPAGHGREIPRSRTNGFDYDPVQNSVVFYGDAQPKDGDEIVIGYRRWDFANDPRTPPDGCDMCAAGTSCAPTSDLVLCEPICGDTICSGGLTCITESASCGMPGTNQTPPPDACNGACDAGLVCNPGPATCIPPCESTGCSAMETCNSRTHLCEIPNF